MSAVICVILHLYTKVRPVSIATIEQPVSIATITQSDGVFVHYIPHTSGKDCPKSDMTQKQGRSGRLKVNTMTNGNKLLLCCKTNHKQEK